MADAHALQKPLLFMVQRGDIGGVRMFIEAGADVNHVWDGGGEEFAPGDTALIVAISGRTYTNPSVNMVNELLALGADAGAHVNIIFEAIDAVANGHANPDFLAALIAAGADVQAKQYDLGTPLHVVCLYCNREAKEAVAVANLLISKGALVDAKNDYGTRPLDIALHVCHINVPHIDAKVLALKRAMAKCLLRAGAATTGLADDLEESPAKTSVDLVLKAGGWKEYALWHKQVLVGLVTKCQPMPDDAAGLVVDFYCPSGGS